MQDKSSNHVPWNVSWFYCTNLNIYLHINVNNILISIIVTESKLLLQNIKHLCSSISFLFNVYRQRAETKTTKSRMHIHLIVQAALQIM